MLLAGQILVNSLLDHSRCSFHISSNGHLIRDTNEIKLAAAYNDSIKICLYGNISGCNDK